MNYSFELAKKPNEIINEYKKVLEDDTQNYVSAELTPFDGHIFNYEKTVPSPQSFAKLFDTGDRVEKVFVQNSLGASESLNETFEYNLLAPLLPNYSFKVFYLRNSLGSYPATLVVEKTVSDEINREFYGNDSKGYVYTVEDPGSFSDLFKAIMDSDHLHNVIQGVIYAAMEKERESKLEDHE